MISIIGAGPAGAYTAYLLSKKGYNVQVYEEHKTVGIPIQCGGIITNKIKEVMNFPNHIIRNKIKYMKITAPNNSSTTIKLKRPDLIINRTEFDQYLTNKAINEGAQLHLNHKLIQQHNNKLKFKNKIIKNSTHIIGADGPNSTIGKSINSRIKQHFIGCQATIKHKFQKDLVQTFLIKEGFAWIIPVTDTTARVGLLTYKNASTKLHHFIKKQFSNSKIIDRQGGLIPIYSPNLKTQKDNKYLIGDSAGMVKATTGGGIIPSLIAAKQLTKSIHKDLNYEKLWKKQLSKPLHAHLLTRNLLNKFSAKDFNKAIKLTNQNKIKQILSTENRDNYTTLLTKMLIKEPRYLQFIKNFF